MFIIYIFSIATDGWLSQWFVRVTLPARDKKYNYSYNDPSAKTEAGEDGPKIDRKQSAKKKSGELLAELLVFTQWCKNTWPLDALSQRGTTTALLNADRFYNFFHLMSQRYILNEVIIN